MARITKKVPTIGALLDALIDLGPCAERFDKYTSMDQQTPAFEVWQGAHEDDIEWLLEKLDIGTYDLTGARLRERRQGAAAARDEQLAAIRSTYELAKRAREGHAAVLQPAALSEDLYWARDVEINKVWDEYRAVGRELQEERDKAVRSFRGFAYVLKALYEQCGDE